jgi:pterin-4a-carbinolamine dehydratase
MNEQTNNTAKPELKAERVQGPEVLLQQEQKKRLPRPDDALRPTVSLTPAQAQQRLKAERVQLRLKQMPSWKMQSGGKAIDRVRQFPDALTAASYLAFAALLARQSGQPLRATVHGNTIMVALPGRSSKGINEEVLDLAEQLG